MKRIKYIAFIAILCLSACQNTLDLYPLAQPSAEKWYSNEAEIQLALNDLYRGDFWIPDAETGSEVLSDDAFTRTALSPIKAGTVNSQWGTAATLWRNSYKAIARANRAFVALNSPETKANVPAANLAIYLAEIRFHRASQYARLVTHFGDVVYSEDVIELDKAYNIGRTDKKTVISKIYADLDAAAAALPKSYAASAVKRITKGAALAMKARTALYVGDFKIAAEAAKACIDLATYSLHPSYANLFLQNTKDSREIVFGLPRSVAFNVFIASSEVLNRITRNSGGFGAICPTWDLFCAYLCTDGLPIDKSPLYDPRNPFKNRDPRCTASIVEFGTTHLGFTYDPNPTALRVLRVATNTQVTNNDNRANAQFASFNGLVWKKGIDDTYLQNGNRVEPDQIIIRYADVLLMYAEAKIELNEIDQSVRDAINAVRARAYGVAPTATASYPAVTATTQTDLRKIVRIERRMEFAFENLRYMDIVRWKLAGKVFSRPIYGMLDPTDLKAKLVDKNLWFFPSTPVIDEDGLANFKPMFDAGLIKLIVPCEWQERQYLWPIPTSEIQINPNMKQNEGY
ncbi:MULTISPECIES: RagB/SusD family nutrient uptake outer membrane protein [Emticicia]|uniref:RagB/SusD family nutrient uptake outer membrane protein n=1 Tax=Emticicia TaxID=312278 RepID=UPI0007D8BFFC|nr:MULTISPECIES: RagB/SusD family nutrient uptake outer membrane protein [Emticicia]